MVMVTHVTYRQAEFSSLRETDAAIEQARVAGWSVSKMQEVGARRFVVLFRHDEENSGGLADGTRAELPAFAYQQDGPKSAIAGGSIAGRVRELFRSGLRRSGPAAPARGAW